MDMEDVHWRAHSKGKMQVFPFFCASTGRNVVLSAFAEYFAALNRTSES